MADDPFAKRVVQGLTASFIPFALASLVSSLTLFFGDLAFDVTVR